MNNSRRQTLNSIKKQTEDLLDQLETVIDEEEEARDNIPENLQETEPMSLS